MVGPNNKRHYLVVLRIEPYEKVTVKKDVNITLSFIIHTLDTAGNKLYRPGFDLPCVTLLNATYPGGVLNFGLGTDVRPEVSTTTL